MFFEEDRIAACREMICSDTVEEREAPIEKILPYQQGDFKALYEAWEGCPLTIRFLDPPLHANGFAVFVLITVGMKPYRYLTGFPKAKTKEITLFPIFCYQSAKTNPCRIRQGISMYKPRIHSYPLY